MFVGVEFPGVHKRPGRSLKSVDSGVGDWLARLLLKLGFHHDDSRLALEVERHGPVGSVWIEKQHHSFLDDQAEVGDVFGREALMSGSMDGGYLGHAAIPLSRGHLDSHAAAHCPQPGIFAGPMS